MKGPCLIRSSLAALVALVACSGDAPPAVHAPAAPSANDPAFKIEHVNGWYLVGNALTPGQDQLDVQVVAPGGTGVVDAWIDDQPGVRLAPADVGFGASFDISALPAGEHVLILGADGSSTGFAKLIFRRTHPLYVVVSTDWDNSNNTDDQLMLQEQLHAWHPELKLTHFVGPYVFTDPTVPDARRTQLADWVKGMRDQYGDEIGLHIHPYCNFVDTTGVTCRIAPSDVYNQGDPTGYTVMCNSYTEQEFTTLLTAASDLFDAHGLGRPTSFRAGGWTADLTVLHALADAGFAVDSSANNWARLEEWIGVQNGVLYTWNKEHWASIGDTSQPYYPSQADILTAAAPNLPVLEVPDNGILADYVTGDEMKAIFDENFTGAPLLAPAAYSIGFHPPDFNTLYQDRIHHALLHVDQFLASAGKGPVVYARVGDLTQIWPH